MALTSSTPAPFAPGEALQDGTALNAALASGILGGVTAGATALGATLATALPLLSTVTQVTAAAALTGVSLRALQPGQQQIVFNAGSGQTITVYPASASYTIDGGGAGAGVSLSNNSRCAYLCIAPGVIISAQLGAVSS